MGMSVQLVDFAIQRLQEKLHQRADFLIGALPVFTGKRKQGQRADAVAKAVFDGRTQRLLSFAVAEAARAMALYGPAAVAIHDNGQMARSTRRRRARGVDSHCGK